MRHIGSPARLQLPPKAVIACIHLLPTPGSPSYGSDLAKIYDTALSDLEQLESAGVDAVIVENFRDLPFYPAAVPPETVATVAAVTREVVNATRLPVGVAVLRNDALASLAVASVTGASFIRVNVHVGAVLAEQGVVTGSAHCTLRRRRELESDVAILADVAVKHSYRYVYPDIETEARDAAARSDGIVISGATTGIETELGDLEAARRAVTKPIYVGSGITPTNLRGVYGQADGFIIGSYFKEHGIASNLIDPVRLRELMGAFAVQRGTAVPLHSSAR